MTAHRIPMFSLALMALAALTWLAGAPAGLAAEPGEEGRQQAAAALDRHIAVLEDVKTEVPEQAQDDVQRAIDESRRLLNDVNATADGDPGDGQRGLEEALAAVDKGTQRHIDMLEGLLEREALTDKARAAIGRALAVSSTGSMVAMERLEMLRSGDTPRGRPDAVRPSDIRPHGVRPDAGRPDIGSRPRRPMPR